MDQETSQSLISHSQTRDSDSSIVESSQSIIPHSLEQGLRSTDENPRIGDLVESSFASNWKGSKTSSSDKTWESSRN